MDGSRTARRAATALLAIGLAAAAHAQPAPGGYRAVKACSLVSLAEMKTLAPWPASAEPHAKAEEVALPQRSMCVYPTAQVQLEAWQPQVVESARRSSRLEPVAGVGDEAWLRNNRDLFALVYARVGPHLLTVEMEIPAGGTFGSAKPTVVGIAKAFAARLR